MRNCISSLLIAVALATGVCFAQGPAYPKPQVAVPSGKPAPDFSLPDQNGAAYSLSTQRGTWVLLYFYRGYW